MGRMSEQYSQPSTRVVACTCDVCGAESDDRCSAGPVVWPDGTTTVMWRERDDDIEEFLLCPRCFEGVVDTIRQAIG